MFGPMVWANYSNELCPLDLLRNAANVSSFESDLQAVSNLTILLEIFPSSSGLGCVRKMFQKRLYSTGRGPINVTTHTAVAVYYQGQTFQNHMLGITQSFQMFPHAFDPAFTTGAVFLPQRVCSS